MHCGNVPDSLEHLSQPYQATLAIWKEDSMKTASFSLSVPKSSALIYAFLAETERGESKFLSWGSDFNLAQIIHMTFAKAVLKFACFHSRSKNCKLN